VRTAKNTRRLKIQCTGCFVNVFGKPKKDLGEGEKLWKKVLRGEVRRKAGKGYMA